MSSAARLPVNVKLPREDRGLPVRQAPSKFCPRQLALAPTQLNPSGYNVKRYMSEGPLFGYIMVCPACGFHEMHETRTAGFIEVGGTLTATEKPIRCMVCSRVISVASGVISAVLHTPVTLP